MKIRRGQIHEVRAGVFGCNVEIAADSLLDFLALMPAPESAVELGLEPALPPAVPLAPAPPVSEIPPAPAMPPPGEPQPIIREGAQIIAPSGLDIARMGMGKSLPREVLTWLVMIRDPLFQEWAVQQSGKPHSEIPDAVEFAGEFVAKAVGVQTLFEVPVERFPQLAALGDRYASYTRTRGLAPGVAPT